MLLGYVSVVASIRNQEQLATWLIIGAAFVDAIDGRTAKLLGATSDIGAQLDTLSDLLTFCVAPGVLVYQSSLSGWGMAGIAISAIPILCGTFRLARFQCHHGHDAEFFAGLPTPAAAGLLVSVVPLSHELSLGSSTAPLAAGIVILTGLLMVSRIRYESDAFLDPRRILTNWRGIFFLIFVASLFVFQGRAAFGAGCVYVLVGLTRSVANRVKGGTQLGTPLGPVGVPLTSQVAVQATNKQAARHW
jgi:CDP-diacylglycerol--serine O-phosphatidyltransferase